MPRDSNAFNTQITLFENNKRRQIRENISCVSAKVKNYINNDDPKVLNDRRYLKF